MFGRAIWAKLPECIFENFEIARVKRGKFQNFQKSRGVIYPQNRPNQTWDYWLITLNQQTLFVLKLIYFNGEQLQIRKRAITKQWRLQNNSINGAMSITINRVINE